MQLQLTLNPKLPRRTPNNETDVDVTSDTDLLISCTYSSKIPLFSLPPEVLGEIFIALVLSRANPQLWRRDRKVVQAAEASQSYISTPDIKRALRLRLVSRAFRDYTNEAIFRTGILDDVINAHHLTPFISDRPQEWAKFLQTYVATLVFRERDRECPRGRFRQVAEQIHKLKGSRPDDDQDLFSCIRGLCELVVSSGGQPGLRELVGPPSPWASEIRYDHLVLEGATCLGLRDVVSRVLKEGKTDPATNGGYKTIWDIMTPRGMTLDRLVQVASLRGDVEMIELLISLSPEVKPGTKFSRDIASIMIGSAALGGHANVFNYALDHGEPLTRDPADACHMYWAVLEQSMLLATEPETYRRSAAALAPPELQEMKPLWGSLLPGNQLDTVVSPPPFSPNSFTLAPFTPDLGSPEPPPLSAEASLAERYGDLLSRITTSARWSRTEMVRFVLEDERGRELGVLNNPDAKRQDYDERRAEWERGGDKAAAVSATGRHNDYIDDTPLKLVPRPTLRPLLSAIEGGDSSMVRMMLAQGADPNWFLAEDTALMAAVQKNNVDMVNALLDAGADINDGAPPPLAIAVRNENEKMFRLLRRRGARVDTPETGGWAMAFANALGLESMADLLVGEGVERDAVLSHVCGLEAKSEYNFKSGDYGPVTANYYY